MKLLYQRYNPFQVCYLIVLAFPVTIWKCFVHKMGGVNCTNNNHLTVCEADVYSSSKLSFSVYWTSLCYHRCRECKVRQNTILPSWDLQTKKRHTHRGSKITLLYRLQESSMHRVMLEYWGALMIALWLHKAPQEVAVRFWGIRRRGRQSREENVQG